MEISSERRGLLAGAATAIVSQISAKNQSESSIDLGSQLEYKLHKHQ
jgi:hypothetical protein